MKINFTANPMNKPENMSVKAMLAWDYFDFGRTWLAAEAADGEIIVTDEGADLNDAFVFSGVDSFIEWMEANTDDKLSDNPKDYLIACGAVSRDVATDAVIAPIVALLLGENVQENENPEPDTPPAPGEYAGGAARSGVDWGYYDAERFTKIDSMYLPSYGEGDTMASQISTAVNKLVYKWYNDGDVYDNTHGMNGWCNDLSSYANWLFANVPGTEEILIRIDHCYTDNAYEHILKDLADFCLEEDRMAEYAKREKTGTIYSCPGPFEFREYDDDDDDDF